MKRLFTSLMFIALTINFFAQVPQKMSYQAVIRNSSGALVTNHAVRMRISILQSSATGTPVYVETQTPTTNANGLATFEIGGGTVVTGTFAGINWASGTYYIKTETDPAGGTNYSIVGTSQLTSVPYALHAKNAATYAETDPVFNAAPAKGITSGNITNWNTTYGWGNHAGLYRPVSWVPTWTDVTGKPAFATVATSGSYNDLTNKPTIINSQWITNGSSIYYNTGNVAIGLTFPNYKLTIYDNNYSYLGFYNSTSGTTITDGFTIGTTPSGSPVWIWNYENSNIHFGTNNLNRMIIGADGVVNTMGVLDINQDGWGAALKVAGKQALWWDGTYFSWGYDGTWNYFADRVSIGRATDPGTSYMLYVQGTAYATGSWSSSDASFKKNISAINNPLNELMKIRGTKFEFRSDEFKDYQFAEGPQFGFIAQELEEVFPEVVKTENDGYKSVNYSGMIPVLLEAIKEQQKQIESTKKENQQLKSELDELKALVSSLLLEHKNN